MSIIDAFCPHYVSSPQQCPFIRHAPAGHIAILLHYSGGAANGPQADGHSYQAIAGQCIRQMSTSWCVRVGSSQYEIRGSRPALICWT